MKLFSDENEHFHRKRGINVTTLHLSFGYPERRLQWVQGNARKKAINCCCACALRVWVSMFFPHSTLMRAFVCGERASSCNRHLHGNMEFDTSAS